MKMKKLPPLFITVFCAIVLSSCAPVLNRQYMKEGERDVSFNALRQNTTAYIGRLYILGGVVVQTKLTPDGSQLEAMDVPVDRYGYFRDRGRSEGRFLAIMPQDRALLDPEVFTKGRRVTIAGEFTGVRKDKIDEMEYAYPVFLIRQVYLWPRETRYYPAYYYDPWFSPYPYYYWDPWWSYPFYPYPYYNNYYFRGGPPPVRRRTLPPNQPPQRQAPMRGMQQAPAPASPQQSPQQGEPAQERQ